VWDKPDIFSVGWRQALFSMLFPYANASHFIGASWLHLCSRMFPKKMLYDPFLVGQSELVAFAYKRLT
jgi:hypothetical protein